MASLCTVLLSINRSCYRIVENINQLMWCHWLILDILSIFYISTGWQVGQQKHMQKNAKSGHKNISIRLNEGKNRLVLKILNRIRFYTSSNVIYLKHNIYFSFLHVLIHHRFSAIKMYNVDYKYKKAQTYRITEFNSKNGR